MSYTIHEHDQGSQEWLDARLGLLTASKAGDMMAQVKSGEAAARRNLRIKLVLERITGEQEDGGFVSHPMKRGIELEPDALAAYEALTDSIVTPVGFMTKDLVKAGASPDGLIMDGDRIVRCVEVKCPLAATHLDYLKTGKVPQKYYYQCLHQIWVAGVGQCDWMSYHPRFPGDLQTKLVTITPTRKEIKEYEERAIEFLGEVKAEEILVLAMQYGHTTEG